MTLMDESNLCNIGKEGPPVTEVWPPRLCDRCTRVHPLHIVKDQSHQPYVNLNV